MGCVLDFEWLQWVDYTPLFDTPLFTVFSDLLHLRPRLQTRTQSLKRSRRDHAGIARSTHISNGNTAYRALRCEKSRPRARPRVRPTTMTAKVKNTMSASNLGILRQALKSLYKQYITRSAPGIDCGTHPQKYGERKRIIPASTIKTKNHRTARIRDIRMTARSVMCPARGTMIVNATNSMPNMRTCSYFGEFWLLISDMFMPKTPYIRVSLCRRFI